MPPARTATTFLDLVERSGLLPADHLAAYRDLDPPGDPARPVGERLAHQLVRDRLLTRFQAAQLVRGKHKGFFLGDKYKVLEPIGAGGMGKVFLCEHLILHKLVAVKLLGDGGKAAPPAGAVERFFREAKAAAALDDKNIARVYDLDWAGNVPFLVMEFVDGADLHRLVQGAGPLPVPQACDYIRQAALGLQHAHEIGLVHRDIKPGNVLVDRAGVVKLLDLGLARFQLDTARNLSITERYDGQAVLGTADFISPEQAIDSSGVDIRADIYSLGCTFYFVLTGKLLWEDGSFTQKLLWHQSRTPPRVRDSWPDVPDAVDEIVDRMLAKDPAERFQTPGEVAEVLGLWSVPRPGPPAAELMPPANPGTYLLGLSPIPPPSSGRTVIPRAVATPTPRPRPPRPTPPPSTPPMSGLATERVRPQTTPPAEPPPAAGPAPASTPAPRHSFRRDLGLLLAGAVLAAAVAGLYVTVREVGWGRPANDPPTDAR
ncbi:MAG: serine/threonine protein kinase [Gemmataceae bacterium]|nr:serine/threonine protein kinase [Gemmataceae bacterium]